MKVYWSFKTRKSAYGGANSFLGSLQREMKKRGVLFTTELNKVDIAFVNALTHESKGNKLRLSHVERIAQLRIPIVHRKTGFWGRGAAEYHTPDKNGIIRGDALQLEFSSSISHHIFQSHYSYNEFVKAGFSSDNYAIIHNGADCSVFNFYIRRFGRPFCKPIWHKDKKFKIAISTWSHNYNKGFEYYKVLDGALNAMPDVEVNLVGRIPDNLQFKNIKAHKPLKQKALAHFLKQNHAIIQCSINDTCSNALIEGLCCGLPAIYLDSGSNKELAGEYGVAFSENWFEDIELLKSQYHYFVEKLRLMPYSIEKAADKYLKVFQKVIKR